MGNKDDRNWLEQTVDERSSQLIPEMKEPEIRTHPFLLILHGEDRGKRIELKEGTLTVGRSPDADLPIQDQRASRIHCTFTTMSNTVYVEDNNSRNGTHVMGRLIKDRAQLAQDVQVRVGHTIFKLTYKHKAEIELEDEIFEAATSDPLTGLPNRRWFEEQATPAIAHAVRHAASVCAVMIDADRFKNINDTHGHSAGDKVLQDMASILNINRRSEDLICRYGGEEFCMLLPSTDLFSAKHLAERIRTTMENQSFSFDDTRIQVTISIGIALFQSGDTLETLLQRADQALYQAKEGGRNCVCLAEQP